MTLSPNPEVWRRECERSAQRSQARRAYAGPVARPAARHGRQAIACALIVAVVIVSTVGTLGALTLFADVGAILIAAAVYPR